MVKIAASVLDCKSRIEGVLDLNKTNISYVHIDVMDGKFVPNVQFEDMGEVSGINLVTKYPMDVHLMVDDPDYYIKHLKDMNIEFITIHLEIDKDKRELFKSIRKLGYKVGLSIKPNTKVKEIEPYLDEIDLVLVMSVEPGLGGQKFMDSTIDRVKDLRELILKSGRDILIEVDGGVNRENITKLDMADVVVVGSYITKSDNYYEQVEKLLSDCDSGKNEMVIIQENSDKLVGDKKDNGRILYRLLLVIGVLLFAFLLGYILGVRIFV